MAHMMHEFQPQRLRELRKTKGWSGQKLADMLNELAADTSEAGDTEREVSQQYVSRWENGKRVPNSKSLSRLAKVFNVSPGYFFGVTDPQTESRSQVARNTLLETLYRAFLEGDERKQAEAVAALKKLDDKHSAAGE